MQFIKTNVFRVAILSSLLLSLLFSGAVSAQATYVDDPATPPETITESTNLSQTNTNTTSRTSDIQNSLCAGANLDVTSNCQSGITSQDATAKINDLIADVINIFSLVVGVVSVIMIIYGGFRYITSGGESNSVSSAKNTILYAIIGLVIVALAQFIVRFVLGRVTDAT
jgi:hypothetical protein